MTPAATRTRLLACALAAAAALLVFTVPAAAAEPEAHGWWWRAQAGLLLPVPPPPQVPEGGLYVEGAPDGPSAVSALRLRVPEGSAPVSIVLRVAQEQGGDGALILACPADGPWIPASAGRWDARPPTSCDGQGVVGSRAEDGSTWTFPLALASFTGVRDFVLTPGVDDARPEGVNGSTFSVAFAPPDDGTFVVEDADMDGGTTVRPPVFTPPGDSGTVPPPFDGAQDTSTVPPAAEVTPVASDPSVLTPRVTPPVREPAGTPVAAGKDARALATLIALLSVGVAGILSRDRLVAGAVPVLGREPDPAEERLGGVGRFRRPRSSPPPPL